MTAEKRLIELIECLKYCADNEDCQKCSRWLHSCERHCVDDLMVTAAETLEKLVDTVEVVHGRWENPSKYGMSTMMDKLGNVCSACASYCDNRFNYCPHCGAKMDL